LFDRDCEWINRTADRIIRSTAWRTMAQHPAAVDGV